MKRLIFFFFFLNSLIASSQNLIDNKWQFSIGDSLTWKERGYNSSTWKIIKSGRSWEEQGYANYDGFAWYRKPVFISNRLQKETIKQGGFILNLGTIDDADQIYFNGKLIGETGKLPPNYVGAYDKIREWTISPKDIRWNQENIIAVRVYDGGGNGGIAGSEVSLRVKGIEDDLVFKPHFPRESQLFLNGENFLLPIAIVNSSKTSIVGRVEYVLVNDFKDTISSWSESLKISAHQKKQVTINKGKLAPGFYTLYADIKSKLLNLSKSYNFGVDPEKIVSPTDKGPDFDNFWMRAKKELAAVEPQFKLIRKDSLCTDKHDVYLVEMRSLENALIRGWYVRPKAEGKYPALLHVQGYGSSPQFSLDYKDEDMVHFILNIRGTGNSRDNINPGFPGYILSDITDRERYIYRGAYMDCVRSVDFLCSRSEVDSRYIVVEGGSQGGALSFATAALNNTRICLCIPAVPFLSDFQNYFKIAFWPGNEFVAFEKNNKGFGWNRIFENLSYFDIKNLAPWIKCPVFMSVGLKDVTCPTHINFAAYNQLTSPKSYHIYPFSGHGLPSEYSSLKYNWMKNELKKLKSIN
ncbi:MAG: acetylxylan esterase [Bacteroidota bacterium]|nr:acetylxylan esterase [Bacteroidota bacterium]